MINNLVKYKIICIILTMVLKVLFAWIGKTDLNASQGLLGDSLGPIGQAAKHRSYTHIFLLSNYQNCLTATDLHVVNLLTLKGQYLN